MRYTLSVSVILFIVLGLVGCNGERTQVEDKAVADYVLLPNARQTGIIRNDVQSQKVRAESLTLGGRRKDGMHYIDYLNPNYMDVVIFTRRAQDYLRRNGRWQALENFMNPDSQFVSGRMYIFAYSVTGECLADWAEPGKVGKVGDSNFMLALRDAAARNGDWVESSGIDPVAGELRPKESYVVAAGEDMIIGAGLYKDSL